VATQWDYVLLVCLCSAGAQHLFLTTDDYIAQLFLASVMAVNVICSAIIKLKVAFRVIVLNVTVEKRT
jgi:hypothetical protein